MDQLALPADEPGPRAELTDPGATVRFNRLFLEVGVGAVLVEQRDGALFVVPARFLERQP
jgi:hypothetical protein